MTNKLASMTRMKYNYTLLIIILVFTVFGFKEKPKTIIPDKKLENTASALTVNQVLNQIKQNLTCEWGGGPIDTIKTGALDNEVTGIATTFMATMEVIKKAKAQGLNLIITHEPTFYNHYDDMKPLKNDPVQQAKLKYINDANITIFRFHDYWHKTRPDGINMGLINTLGWQEYGDSDQMIFNIPKTTVEELSKSIAEKFGTSTVRVVGNPAMSLTTVGIVPGAWGSDKQIEMLNQSGVEAVIVGESREWETVEYVRDMNELGMPKALIVMGHADSEDPGMEYCAEWLKGFITQVPVKYIRAGNPLWTAE